MMMKWLKVHSPTAQTVSTAWVVLGLMWTTNHEFRDYVWGVYEALPHGLHRLLACVIIPACILWRSQRKRTAIATAEVGEGAFAQASARVPRS